MLLAELISSLAPLQQAGSLAREITGIAYDSRQVQPGFAFVAIPGFQTDGHNYLFEAAARGAVAALIQKDVPVPEQMTSILVADTRKALSQVAARFYGYPAQQLKLIGVTGTNGKTTTAFLIDSVLQAAGHKVGLLGTVKLRIGDQEYPVQHTTPESLDLQHYLAMMVDKSLEYAVMEVSSHALALDRVQDCEFDVAVFTNLTQDHLDLHGTMEDYLAAKARLFSGLQPTGKPARAAVINLDDAAAGRMIQCTRVPVVTYGIREAAAVQAVQIDSSSQGVSFWLQLDGRPVQRLTIQTPGVFSVYNALAATAACLTQQVPLDVIAAALAAVPGVPGRFQPVRKGQDFDVIVDYAHTPDGLENILRTARAFAAGQVAVVFGCGGDRDRGKRSLMGELASRLADRVIITSDNPRSEDPVAIAADILQGIADRSRVSVELDRAQAIRQAIAQAQRGDVVLIAGKGHETYQIFRDRTIHFDDFEIAEQAVEARLNEAMDSRGDQSNHGGPPAER
ncbi:MAG: UDP-N-acetylmuramoyl-L-alanyl-D-glutamate--2,6-diaminopimelate ligase [Bacillota bacterium]|jgi:UDP-N-acetylmuramoyl-L-alanyl-D-glutamate--2,6-diaminopimelate ligase